LPALGGKKLLDFWELARWWGAPAGNILSLALAANPCKGSVFAIYGGKNFANFSPAPDGQLGKKLESLA